MRKVAMALSFSLLTAAGAAARDLPATQEGLRVWSEPASVDLGGSLLLRIEAVGNAVSPPDIGASPDFRVSPRPVEVHRGTMRPQGERLERLALAYRLVPLRAGRLRLPAVSVRIGDRVVRGPRTYVEVVEAAETPLENVVILEMEPSRREVFVHEGIVLTQRRYIRAEEHLEVRETAISGPRAEGFYVVETSEGSSGQLDRAVERNGAVYRLQESRSMLFPARPGTLQVGQWQFEGIALLRGGPVAATPRTVLAEAGPLEIRARPLPAAPPGFSGAVGRFDARIKAPASAVQGVPVDFVLTVSGVGNPAAIGTPALFDLSWAVVEPPETATQIQAVPDGVRARKTFRFPVALTRAGALKVPVKPFVYFDPDTARYEEAALGPLRIEVAAGPGGPRVLQAHFAAPTGDVPDMQGFEGPLPRQDALKGIPVPRRLVWVIFAAVPLVALRFLLAGVPVRPITRPRHSSAKWAMRGALDSSEPASAIAGVVRRHAFPEGEPAAAALTAKEVGERLRAEQMDAALALRIERLLIACERHQYAGERNADAERALAREGLACIGQVERHKIREKHA